MYVVQIRPFLEDSKEAVFSKNYVKTCDFCVTKLVIFPKNGPTSSTSPRLVSPVSALPKRDTPFLTIRSSFYQEKSRKTDRFDDFLIVFDHRLSQNVHVQFTFKNPHILQNQHQVQTTFSENIPPKIQKQTLFFAQQESEKLGHLCPKSAQLGGRHGGS